MAAASAALLAQLSRRCVAQKRQLPLCVTELPGSRRALAAAAQAAAAAAAKKAAAAPAGAPGKAAGDAAMVKALVRRMGGGAEGSADKVAQEVVDVDGLLALRSGRLKKLGINVKQRKRILRFAEEYRKGAWTPRLSVTPTS